MIKQMRAIDSTAHVVRQMDPTSSGSMTERRYAAEYRWDERAWIVQFRQPDIATFGRSLVSAKRHARSALAVYLEVDDLVAAGIEVVDDIRLPPDVAGDVDSIVERRTLAEALRAEVAAATRRAATELRSRGFSTRDIGEILGVSGARVAQIEREGRAG